MKRIVVLLLIVAVCAASQTPKKAAAKKTATKAPAPLMKTEKDTLSYALGFNIASRIMNDLAKGEVDLTPELFVKGFGDMVTGTSPVLSEDAAREAIMKFQSVMQQKQQLAMKEYNDMLEKNKKAEAEFLAVNSKKDSVQTTASGLQYKMIRAGEGKSPTDSSEVTVHYRGKLLDSTVFDESYARGEPTKFHVNQVIKGWSEGLKLMKEGGKCEFYIPSALGYGERGAGQTIPPNSALIFDVELIKVD